MDVAVTVFGLAVNSILTNSVFGIIYNTKHVDVLNMTPKAFQRALPLITVQIDQEPLHVFKQIDLKNLLERSRDAWSLGTRVGTQAFINALVAAGRLSKVSFPFPAPYKPETRYVWGTVPLLAVCASLRPGGYFSHYTAVRLNDLTEQLPHTIYVNVEQVSSSQSTGTLTQASIDSALRRAPRMTKQIAEIGDHRVVLLQGKNTSNLGVVTRSVTIDPQYPPVSLSFTNLPRTLIDIAVRPQYAGGIAEVLKAFVNARGSLVVSEVADILARLSHIYPYHQVIGFYLERAGYADQDVELFRRQPMPFDFQIIHGLTQSDYVSQWKLRIPAGF